jgi:hypothetical protein
MTSDSTGPIPPPNDPPKWLERLVWGMGILLVVMFLTTVGGIIYKIANRAPPPPVPDVVQDLGLDPGAIRQMTMDGDHLAITTDKELVVINVRERKVVLRSFKP